MPGELIRQGLEDARQSFAKGDLRSADAAATVALERLRDAAAREAPLERRRVDAAIESALWAVRGGVAVHEGKLDEGRQHFEQSRERARVSGNADAIGAAALNLIDVDTRRGSCDANDPLLDEAARATRAGPHEDLLVKLVIERGLAATHAGSLDAALALQDRAIALRPAWPFAWYQRGWMRFLRGDAAGALEDYRACARIRSPFFTVLREIRCLEDVAAGRLPIAAFRSFCFVRDRVRERPAAAAESAELLIARHPDFAPAHLLLAEAALAQGDAARARDAAAHALHCDPDADTAAATLFLEWNLARTAKDHDAQRAAEDRLLTAYREHAPAEVVRRVRAAPRDVRVRWTWALDGTFRMDEDSPLSDWTEGTPRR